MSKKKKILLYLSGALIICLLILYRLFGIQGKSVLAGNAFFSLSVILLGALMIWGFADGPNKTQGKAIILSLVMGIFLVCFGIFSGVNVVKDMAAGPVVTDLSDCHITSRSGMHGILGLQYYLSGTDSLGNKREFPVSYSARVDLEGMSDVTVECYENTGRIISCY